MEKLMERLMEKHGIRYSERSKDREAPEIFVCEKSLRDADPDLSDVASGKIEGIDGFDFKVICKHKDYLLMLVDEFKGNVSVNPYKMDNLKIIIEGITDFSNDCEANNLDPNAVYKGTYDPWPHSRQKSLIFK